MKLLNRIRNGTQLIVGQIEYVWLCKITNRHHGGWCKTESFCCLCGEPRTEMQCVNCGNEEHP